jgi:hypothetical protein
VNAIQLLVRPVTGFHPVQPRQVGSPVRRIAPVGWGCFSVFVLGVLCSVLFLWGGVFFCFFFFFGGCFPFFSIPKGGGGFFAWLCGGVFALSLSLGLIKLRGRR